MGFDVKWHVKCLEEVVSILAQLMQRSFVFVLRDQSLENLIEFSGHALGSNDFILIDVFSYWKLR